MSRRVALGVLGALTFHVGAARAVPSCWERLDTGLDMKGWHRSATNHHGPGDGWTVEGGAFVGRQTAGNQGGILMTDKSYKDVEVIFEVKIDWGCDSGFFFRTTAGDRAYQVNIDHLQDAGVGTIYGEGFAQELRYRPYFLSNNGTTATKDPVLTPIFDLSKWSTIWKPTDFNEIRARVEGNPPHMQVWIAGTQVMDFTDAMQRAEIDAQGPLAIQVHGGAERWIPNGSVSFRNIRVKDLTLPCDDGAGGAGSGGNAGAGGSGSGGSAGNAGTSSGGANSAGGNNGGTGGASAGNAASGNSAGGQFTAGSASGGNASGGNLSGGNASGGVITNDGLRITQGDDIGSSCGCRAVGSSRAPGSVLWIWVGLACAASWPRRSRRRSNRA